MISQPCVLSVPLRDGRYATILWTDPTYRQLDLQIPKDALASLTVVIEEVDGPKASAVVQSFWKTLLTLPHDLLPRCCVTTGVIRMGGATAHFRLAIPLTNLNYGARPRTHTRYTGIICCSVSELRTVYTSDSRVLNKRSEASPFALSAESFHQSHFALNIRSKYGCGRQSHLNSEKYAP